MRSWLGLNQHEQSLLEVIEDIRETAEVAGDVDEFYCETVRKLSSVTWEAETILREALLEMDRDDASRRVEENPPSA